jgi:hypothetical protein
MAISGGGTRGAEAASPISLGGEIAAAIFDAMTVPEQPSLQKTITGELSCTSMLLPEPVADPTAPTAPNVAPAEAEISCTLPGKMDLEVGAVATQLYKEWTVAAAERIPGIMLVKKAWVTLTCSRSKESVTTCSLVDATEPKWPPAPRDTPKYYTKDNREEQLAAGVILAPNSDDVAGMFFHEWRAKPYLETKSRLYKKGTGKLRCTRDHVIAKGVNDTRYACTFGKKMHAEGLFAKWIMENLFEPKPGDVVWSVTTNPNIRFTVTAEGTLHCTTLKPGFVDHNERISLCNLVARPRS